jgi:hypothetical protein
MNERIAKLYDQALVLESNGDYVAGELDPVKFAELIVEECRYVMDCNKGSDQNPAWNQALSETSEKIKEHFGVE